MIARFRPTYSYSDIVFSCFSNEQQEIVKLKTNLEEMFSTKHVFLFSEGRVALYVLLRALDVKGEVILPAYTCIVVPDAVRFAGLENRFADISLKDFNMNSNTAGKVLTNKSKILLATHQFGIPCDIESLQRLADKKNLVLIEDAAAAMGAKVGSKQVGTYAKASFFSFQDTKVISAIEGGCLVIFDDKLAERVKSIVVESYNKNAFHFLKKALIYKSITLPFFYSLVFPVWTKIARAYTMAEKSEEKMPADYVVKMNGFCAALINNQLDDLEKNIKRRNVIAQRFLTELKGNKDIVLPELTSGVVPAWSRFPIRVNNKEKFFEKVASQGIDLAWTFSYSCSEVYNSGKCMSYSKEAAETVLNLPLYPGLSFQEVGKIINSLNNL